MATPNFADRTIWTGDNLDILRGMNSECVDLIYLDPPFNSNRDYSAPIGSQAAGAAFKDTWTLNDVDLAWHGLIAEEHPGLYSIIDAAGVAHGKGMKSYLIMMAVRLLEMRRVLKPTGSIYLHCDPTASHYLKLLMDAVFGPAMYLNEMTWKRSSAHSDTRQGMRRAGKIRDIVLVYSKSEDYAWNPQYMPYTEDYLEAEYRHITHHNRRYKETDVTAAKPGGDTEYLWHVKRPTHEKARWSADLTEEHLNPKPGWEYKAVKPYRGRYWAYSKANLTGFWNEGRLIHRETGMPRLMQFADDMPGIPLQDLWDDIPPVLGKERVGYPTQKPLALLERIVRASSNEGDLVLDPFCGCATACVAAENLGRRWVGIDISPKAVELVNTRLSKTMGSLFHSRLVTARTDVPRRTDTETPINYKEQKHDLFGRQEGLCGGCKVMFPFRNFTIDHVVPRSRGGTDHIENLQLLCGACNSIKGDRPQEYLVARLQEIAVTT
ncbi:MAG: DNA methyltransferase [Chloroflexota bacterium]|nr:DNA methyltransferase [Chloroflexota bacterium]MDE2942435.1 DNA methyltransferase [Chloroflexota bacterium]MDE3267885.1 DNA methyltransferase [Chloroflexota bacterium]